MRRRLTVGIVTVGIVALAASQLTCAGAATITPERPKEAAHPDHAVDNAVDKASSGLPSAPDVAPSGAEPKSLPTECMAQDDLCVLPEQFGQRLCDGVFPEVALQLFAKESPWKRAYLRRSFQAWHVGSRSEPRELRSGEEVIIVHASRKGSGGSGVQIGSGGRSFDVVRWNGTCVSLMEDEISFHRMPTAHAANIKWRGLDPSFQTALREERVVATLQEQELRACARKDKTKCELAKRRLAQGIRTYVASGNKLPRPPFIP